MRRMKSITVPGLILLLVAAGLLTRDVVGEFMAMGRPTSVATVNLLRVFEGLEQRADAEITLKALAEEMIAEDEAKQGELKALQEQLEATPVVDTAARDRLGEDIAMKLLDYNAWRAFKAEQLDIEKSLLLRNLHRSVQMAISEVSRLNRYDVVLNDDSAQPLTAQGGGKISREDQIRQRMMMQRVLYTDPTIVDISEELIERMNNAFRKGG